MAQAEDLSFIDHSKVPERVWNVEGPHIVERLKQLKEVLKDNLIKVLLFPNASHVNYGTGETITGVVYLVKKGTPVHDFINYLGPLYQHVSVFNLGNLTDQELKLCKEKWGDIIDPPQARNTRPPGAPSNNFVDLLDSYQQKIKNTASEWHTSLGSNYPCFGGVYKASDDSYKLFLAGGHESLHKKLLSIIASKKQLSVEDLAISKSSINSETSLHFELDAIKDLQKINHSFIAAKLLKALNKSSIPDEPFKTFTMPVPANYSCFYNTVHELHKHRGGMNAHVYAITQGVVDVGVDMEVLNQESNVKLYLLESPANVYEMSVHKEHLHSVKYFPLTTGWTSKADYGMSVKDKEEVRNSLHWTGLAGVSPVATLNFQPNDSILKASTNTLFNHQFAVAVESTSILKGQVYSTTGVDPRTLTIDDYIKNTAHLPDVAMVRAPYDSAPVRLIFNTFSLVLDHLQTKGYNPIQLFSVVKTSSASNHYAEFPVGSLRIAQKVKNQTLQSDDLDHLQGLPRLKVSE